MKSYGFEGSPFLKLKNRKANCHPDRKHFARGMCRPCYRQWHGSVRPRRPSRAVYQRIRRERINIVRNVDLRDLNLRTPKIIKLTLHFCRFCNINFNPKLKLPSSPDSTCSLCDEDIARGANMNSDKMEGRWGWNPTYCSPTARELIGVK